MVARVPLFHSGDTAFRGGMPLADKALVFEATAQFHKWVTEKYGFKETYYIMPKQDSCLGDQADWSNAIAEDLGEHIKYRIKA